MSSSADFDRRTLLQPASSNGRDTGTAETDENYDLFSVLYHCLKAADACTQYVADAEDAGDEELVDFFDTAREQHNRLAREARAILARRISEPSGGDDDE